MTNTRTVATVEAAIAFLDKTIADTESFIRDLRAALETAPLHDCVIGYAQYGWYLNANHTMGGVLWAKRFSAHAAIRFPKVTNGKGEVAQVETYRTALVMAISQQEDQVTNFWGMYRDLEAELCGLLDAAADEAAYYDQFDGGMAYERERHP